MTLTYEDGQKVERRFVAAINNEEDFDKFIEELRKEYAESKVPIYVEIWSELAPIKVALRKAKTDAPKG